MAQVLLLKIGVDSLPQEHSNSGDDITFATITANGGPVMSSTGIDMNNDDISDLGDLTLTDALSSITFQVATDTANELDQLIIPSIAGTPTATPTNGEGSLVWDSTNNILYIWDGAVWSNSFVVIAQAQAVVDILNFVADTGGVTANDCVYISGSGLVKPADASAPSTSRAIGFAYNTAIATAAVQVYQDGVMSGFTGLTAGSRYFLSETAGAITSTAPTTSGAEVLQVGYAATATKLKILFQHIGVRA